MDEVILNNHFDPENIIIHTEREYKKILKNICMCCCCLFIIILMNYFSFCIGFIYREKNDDGSLSLL